MVTTDGVAVLLNSSTGDYWQLNRTGTMMLEELLRADSFDGALSTLRETFDAPPEKVRHDLETFLAGLRRAGVVQ